jgi:anti-sigma factor RsiW
MTCRELIDFLMDYFSGEIAKAARDDFDAHLATCPSCVAYLKSYEATVRMGKAVCDPLDEEVPDDVPEELVQAILSARKKQA